jgi:hypothetical protein
MLWAGLLVCGALCLLFWIARSEVVQGQLMDDRALVERRFPGARLIIRNSHGSGYARP